MSVFLPIDLKYGHEKIKYLRRVEWEASEIFRSLT
jgi:hypothetical protein